MQIAQGKTAVALMGVVLEMVHANVMLDSLVLIAHHAAQVIMDTLNAIVRSLFYFIFAFI